MITYPCLKLDAGLIDSLGWYTRLRTVDYCDKTWDIFMYCISSSETVVPSLCLVQYQPPLMFTGDNIFKFLSETCFVFWIRNNRPVLLISFLVLSMLFMSCESVTLQWRGIHRGPVNSPHKWPVTRKMLPFDDVIMTWLLANVSEAFSYYNN